MSSNSFFPIKNGDLPEGIYKVASGLIVGSKILTHTLKYSDILHNNP